MPPELWVYICRLAATCDKPIVLYDVDDKSDVAASVAQPAITRVCKAIRDEALKDFYSTMEVCADDDGEVAFYGVRDWVEATWTTTWPLVKKFTIESEHVDIHVYLLDAFKGRNVAFSTEAPNGHKEIKFTVTITGYGASGWEVRHEAKET